LEILKKTDRSENALVHVEGSLRKAKTPGKRRLQESEDSRKAKTPNVHLIYADAYQAAVRQNDEVSISSQRPSTQS